jgi:hypothetical protein
MQFSYYQFLGVSQSATTDEINKAYRVMIKRYHPDVVGEDGRPVTEYLNLIHDTLTDEQKRAEYDQQLAAGINTASDSQRPENQQNHNQQSKQEYHQPKAYHTTSPSNDKPASQPSDHLTSTANQQPRSSAIRISFKFMIITTIISVLAIISAFVVTPQVLTIIPSISVLPNHPIMRCAWIAVFFAMIIYLMIQMVHGRSGQAILLLVSAIITAPVMALVPGYQSSDTLIVTCGWLLVSGMTSTLEIVRYMLARRYETLTWSAELSHRQVYMIMSVRYDGGTAISLISDEQNRTSTKALWGPCKAGDYVILGDGDDVIKSVPNIAARSWVEEFPSNALGRLIS